MHLAIHDCLRPSARPYCIWIGQTRVNVLVIQNSIHTLLYVRESPNSWAIYGVGVCMKLLILCLRSLAGFRLHLLGSFFYSWLVGVNFPRAI